MGSVIYSNQGVGHCYIIHLNYMLSLRSFVSKNTVVWKFYYRTIPIWWPIMTLFSHKVGEPSSFLSKACSRQAEFYTIFFNCTVSLIRNNGSFWSDEYTVMELFDPPSSKKPYLTLFECNRVVEYIPQMSPHVATCWLPNNPPLAASTGSWGAPRWPLLKAWERTWELRFSVMVESWIRILWWQHVGLMKTQINKYQCKYIIQILDILVCCTWL